MEGGVRDITALNRLAGVGGGQLIVRGTGIIASVIVERFVAGDSIAAIALDYQLHPDLIERAIGDMLSGAVGRRGFLRAIEKRVEKRVPVRGRR